MKGQGLSLTTIVVAAIALIVLVVLIAIFTGRIGGVEVAISGQEEGNFCCSSSGTGIGGVNCGTANVEGTWKLSCEPGEIPVYGPLADSDSNKGMRCCRERTQ